MSFEWRGESVIGMHDLEELKLIYRTLHRHLPEHIELMDSHFLIELQNFLQRQASKEGVDVGHHGAWDQWLGNMDPTPCDVRMRNRRVIDPDRS